MSFRIPPFLGKPLKPYHTLAKGLVGCWIFDPVMRGELVPDLSANKNPFDIFTNNPVWTISGLNFTAGSSQSISRNLINQIVSDFPMSWVVIVDTPISTSNIYLINFVDPGSNNDYVQLIWSATNGVSYVVRNGGANPHDPNYAAAREGSPVTVYRSIIGVSKKSNLHYGYRDGQLVATEAVSSGIDPGLNKLSVGSSLDSTPAYGTGTVKAIYVYNRALTHYEAAWIDRDPYAMFKTDFDLLSWSAPPGTVCWGHDTGVVEANVRDFSGNWTGTASIQGAGDAERLQYDSGENEESETWNIGPGRVKITIDKYGAGLGAPVVKYKSGNSQANCEADAWHAYTGSFVTTGWIKVRVECA